jgi:hypothetical protein
MANGMSGHGNDNRGLVAGAMPGVAFGRYGRMFEAPPSAKLPVPALQAIADAMIKQDDGKPITEAEPVDENPTIPSGYTYFGQFIDHDITLDPTPFNSSERDVDALIDFRTPSLDLDCVYGRGPDDQPYMYDGLQLRVGKAPGNADAEIGTLADVLRLEDGAAILGDKRNDENKIVSQIQGALIQLHNKVVMKDDLITQFGGDPSNPTSRFRAAANLVRWHYQWIVVHDYLERICEPGMVAEVLNPGGTPRLPNYIKADALYSYMPVEFAGAAFRFGHSMVRPSYALNKLVKGDDKTRIPTFSRKAGSRENLNGFPGTLPEQWGIDWSFFVELPGVQRPEGFQVPQPSYRIDALLVSPLADLPEFFKQTDTSEKKATLVGHLAFRNLLRGQMLGLPSGQGVAECLGIVPLSDDVLWSAGSRLIDPDKLGDDKHEWEETTEARASVRKTWVDNSGPLAGNTPLWYYNLREAEYYGTDRDQNDERIGMGGQHLGPVGSRIIAETLIGLLWSDRTSFLHDLRGFQPLPEITNGKSLTLGQLLTYALTK